NLKNILGAYVCTYLNHVEGLNIPSTTQYIIPTVTPGLFGEIVTYDSFEFKDFSVNYVSSTPSLSSFREFKFLCNCEFCDCKSIPDNPNIFSYKYYCIALTNYIFYTIIHNEQRITPTLVLPDLNFPFNTLPYQNQSYVYTSNAGGTFDINKLFWMTWMWNVISYQSFFGTGQYFDPVDLPDQKDLCSGWTTTPLIKNLFYLFYRYDDEFLRQIYWVLGELSSSDPSLLFKASTDLYGRTTNLERVIKI